MGQAILDYKTLETRKSIDVHLNETPYYIVKQTMHGKHTRTLVCTVLCVNIKTRLDRKGLGVIFTNN